MKKTVSVLLILVLMLSVTACVKNTIKITFDSQGGSAVSELEVEKGTKITLPADPTKDGMVFSGWFTGENGSGTQVIDSAYFTSSTTVYAYWTTGKVYDITFDPQNGNALQTYKTVEDSFINMPEEPIRNGYIFSGWFTAVNGLGDKLATSTPATADITYYAYWQTSDGTNIPTGTTGSPAQLPAVYLEVSGGTPEYNPHVSVNGKVELPTPSRDGYTFGGWFTERNGGGTQYISSTQITKDVRLYAYWISNTPETKTFTLTLYVDGAAYKTYTINENDKQELPTPTKSGYKFSGWFTGQNGSGTQITSSTPVTQNVTAYASFDEIKEEPVKYTVTFHYNDGTNQTVTKTTESGRAVSIPEITREGYTLTGWQTEDGTAFTNLTAVKTNTDVYAQWKQNEPQPPEDNQSPENPME